MCSLERAVIDANSVNQVLKAAPLSPGRMDVEQRIGKLSI